MACLTGAPCRLSHADPMVEAMLVLHGLMLALLLDLRLCCQGFITCTLAEVCGTMSRTLTKPLQHPQGKAKGERATSLGSSKRASRSFKSNPKRSRGYELPRK